MSSKNSKLNDLQILLSNKCSNRTENQVILIFKLKLKDCFPYDFKCYLIKFNPIQIILKSQFEYFLWHNAEPKYSENLF
jgi:hypothetical protein